MHSWAAMLIEIDKKQEIGLVTSCSKIKDNTLKWHGIVCNYTDLKKINGNYKWQSIQKKMLYILHLYYEESHYFNDPQLWNIKKQLNKNLYFDKMMEGMLGKNANSFVKWCLRSKIECVHLYIF